MTEEVLIDTKPTIPPTSQTQFQLFKYLLFVLAGLLLLSAGAAGGYWYGVKISNLKTQMPKLPLPTENLTSIEVPAISSTPTPDPTADWKTYLDKDDGFLFKYPNDWVFSEFPARDSDPKIIAVTSNVQGSADTGPLGTVTKFMYRVSVSD